MAAQYPSGTNTFVPSFEASGHLVVAFSRNPKTFPLNQYVTITPVKKTSGYFLKLTAEQAARVLNSDYAESVWHDGNDAPTGEWNRESFEFKPFNTVRYSEAFRLGYLMEELADWQIEASHAAIHAAKLMTGRTVLTLGVLTDSTQYDTGHNDTATNWGGGKWDSGTETDPRIKKAINKMARKIQVDTIGVVQPKDLVLVVNPVLASAMGASQEIHSYLARSPYAMDQVTGRGGENPNEGWGLPPKLYGIKVVIEDVVKVSSAKGAARSAAYVLPDATALLLARPGELVGAPGAASFSSAHLFMQEEMTVETKDDPDNRRRVGRVTDNFQPQLVASAATCMSTSCI